MTKKFNARPYQAVAIKKIIENPAVCLMLDMGMGKTVATLTAIQELIYNRFEVQKVLVIAPLRVAETTWLDECATWEHLDLKIVPVLGALNKRISALKTNADVYVINRENVSWLADYYGKDFPFDMVVIDESSSFKNSQSKRFKSLRKVRPLIKRVVELTGTPAPNSLMDLWSQIFLLDRGERLGRTIGEYRRKYFDEGMKSGHIVYNWNLKKGADKVIHKKIADLCVSMKSEDYLILPPVINNFVKIPLDNAVQKLYLQFTKELVAEIDGQDLVASTAAVLANKLLQFANGAVYDSDDNVAEIHSAKLDALAEIRETVNQSLLIFYWFKHDLARLQEKFPDAVTLKSADDIKKWNAGKISMLLVHPASAGHGLNLQYGGSVIIWFSLTWSLELYQQANKRLHRIGQEKPVVIHHLIAQNTIDENVVRVLSDKNARQNDLLNALKQRLSRVKPIH
ncbi:MAG: DEAD/DEAH box helicase [Selenomonadaceae bacterium]|nr:DEAD/DEAH box helicase [Selenomonadaceae bacterium]